MNMLKKLYLAALFTAGLRLIGAEPSAAGLLSKQWSFSRQTSHAALTAIPAGSTCFELDRDGGIDLDRVAGSPGKRKDECIVFNRFELDEARDLGFGAGADWWMEVYLNGEKIYSTFPGGNGGNPVSAEDHVFPGKGRKGANLLAVKVRRGGKGWSFYLKVKSFAAADPSSPAVFTMDPGRVIGRIKPMNAVNNGPVSRRGRGNLRAWRAAAIPYARNHDAAFCSSYGGEHTVDVHAVFPDFAKDPTDPASYRFAETDRYLKSILSAGTGVFYRLGSKIEHGPVKYGTKVPADPAKWAVVCEHIIRHYNEGWADGFRMNIQHWEIWNEPDLTEGQFGSPTWSGTPEQFFALYRTAATHLKRCFPHLKIGGPALAGNLQWMKAFLSDMTRDGKPVPLDFFSWHFYGAYPDKMAAVCREIRRMLDGFGYTKTESILNEWNYVRGWNGGMLDASIRSIIGLKGAAYAGAGMCACQNAPADMLMYYDARPCVFNGLFDFYTYAPLKTYYVFLAWSKLAALGRQIAVDTQGKNGIYAVGASDGAKTGILISRFFEPDELPGDLPVTLVLKNGDLRGAKLYRIDREHDLAEVPCRADADGSLRFSMPANTLVYLEK